MLYAAANISSTAADNKHLHIVRSHKNIEAPADGAYLRSRHQADGVYQSKKEFVMFNLGKVSVETRGDKGSFLTEDTGEPLQLPS